MQQIRNILYNIIMNPINITELTKKGTKTKAFHTRFNPILWDLFKKLCEEEGTKPTHKLEQLMIEELKRKGKL